MGEDTPPLHPRPPPAPCRRGVELQQPGSGAPEDGVSRRWPEAEVRPPEVRPGGCTGTRLPGSMQESRRCVHARLDPALRLLSKARARVVWMGRLLVGSPHPSPPHIVGSAGRSPEKTGRRVGASLSPLRSPGAQGLPSPSPSSPLHFSIYFLLCCRNILKGRKRKH